MKPDSSKEHSINKYKAVNLLIAILLSNALTVFVMPFIILRKYNLALPWYYIAISFLALVFICIHGIILDKCYSKACKEIKKYSREFEFKNLALIHMYNELKKAKMNLDKFSDELEKKVFEKTESIQNLLNNAGQGFLSFGIDLLVDKEYSIECNRIFNRDIMGQNICKLIFPNDPEMQELIESVTHQVLNEQDESKREIYLSLLPNDVCINQKQIHIDYKVIRKSINTDTYAIMLILTDTTDRCKLEKQMENEKNVLKMVVNIITNFSDFIYCIKDYENFCKNRIFEIINTSFSVEEIIIRIYRAIHTFKGNFGQFGLNNITSKLHQFEHELSELKNNINNLSLKDLETALFRSNLWEWIDEDINILKNILGDSFLNNYDIIEIDKKKLLELENKMLSVLSPMERNLILPDLMKFRNKPFRELLKSYSNYIVGLADRFNKQINPLEILGGDFFVEPQTYNSFIKSLGHVFRDIMEYGIEPWEERISAGKSETGSIKCTVELIENAIKLTIADDGRGIDMEQIKRTAIEKGFYTAEEINHMEDSEIISLIFCDGFSTNSKISDLSGRGMGLSAVKDEVDNLGGSIEVETVLGLGTTFTFLLPYYEFTDLPSISEHDLMSKLIDTTKNFFTRQIFFNYADNKNIVNKVESIKLREVSVLISVKGIINGIIIFSADKSLLETILSYFNLKPSNSDEEEISIEDVLAECTNMIMGNFSKTIERIEDYINFETPVALVSRQTIVKNASTGIWTSLLESDKGNMEINYLSPVS